MPVTMMMDEGDGMKPCTAYAGQVLGVYQHTVASGEQDTVALVWNPEADAIMPVTVQWAGYPNPQNHAEADAKLPTRKKARIYLKNYLYDAYCDLKHNGAAVIGLVDAMQLINVAAAAEDWTLATNGRRWKIFLAGDDGDLGKVRDGDGSDESGIRTAPAGNAGRESGADRGDGSGGTGAATGRSVPGAGANRHAVARRGRQAKA